MMLDHQPGPEPGRGRPVLEESLPSRADSRQEVVDRYTEEIRARGWIADDEVNWLQLCLEEVFVNAMVHGNEGDPDLPVRTSLRDDGDCWELMVADHGDGFAPGEVPDPADLECLLYEYGRGILLMQGWLDGVHYYDGGATVVLRRRKTVEPTLTAEEPDP